MAVCVRARMCLCMWVWRGLWVCPKFNAWTLKCHQSLFSTSFTQILHFRQQQRRSPGQTHQVHFFKCIAHILKHDIGHIPMVKIRYVYQENGHRVPLNAENGSVSILVNYGGPQSHYGGWEPWKWCLAAWFALTGVCDWADCDLSGQLNAFAIKLPKPEGLLQPGMVENPVLRKACLEPSPLYIYVLGVLAY